MSGVVMEKQNAFHIRIERKPDHAAEWTVSPPDVSLIFLVGILRIQNRDFAILQKFHHFGSFRGGKISRCVPVNSILRRELHFERLVRFVVWHVCDRPGAGNEAITGADARMIRKLCLHLHLADVKLNVLLLLDRKMNWLLLLAIG